MVFGMDLGWDLGWIWMVLGGFGRPEVVPGREGTGREGKGGEGKGKGWESEARAESGPGGGGFITLKGGDPPPWGVLGAIWATSLILVFFGRNLGTPLASRSLRGRPNCAQVWGGTQMAPKGRGGSPNPPKSTWAPFGSRPNDALLLRMLLHLDSR